MKWSQDAPHRCMKRGALTRSYSEKTRSMSSLVSLAAPCGKLEIVLCETGIEVKAAHTSRTQIATAVAVAVAATRVSEL